MPNQKYTSTVRLLPILLVISFGFLITQIDAGMNSWLDMNTRCEGLCFYFSGSYGYTAATDVKTPKENRQKLYHDEYGLPGGVQQCSPTEILPTAQACNPMVMGLTDNTEGTGPGVVKSSILKAYDPEQSVYVMDHFIHKQDPTTNACKKSVFGSNYNKYQEECRIIVSVQKYTPPNCHLYDRQVLNDRLCLESQTNTLYKITMASRFDDYSCDFVRNGNRPCNPREFIAISFPSRLENPYVETKEQNAFCDPKESEQNPWFTCILGEDHVTAWYGRSWEELKEDENLAEPKINGMRYMFEYGQAKYKLTLTEPYSNGAPAVFWSTVRKVEHENTILCSFIITDRAVEYNPVKYDPTNKLSYSTGKTKYWSFGYFGYGYPDPSILNRQGPIINSGLGWHIRLAEGLIQRGEDYNRDYVTANAKKKTEEEILAKISKIHDQTIAGINFYRFVIVTENPVLTEKAILAATPLRKPPKDIEETITGNSVHLKEMSKVYKHCRSAKSLCYFVGEETGCITKEKCHFLVAIKAEKDWSKIYFDYVYHAPVVPSEVRLLKPLGWVGLGISKDKQMGEDMVLTCSFSGHHSSDIYITLNTINPRSNLYYPKAPYQSYIKNPQIAYGKFRDEVEPRVHCSFYIETKDFKNFDLSQYRFGKSLEYDLEHEEYNLLLAFGTGLMQTLDIPYHGKDRKKAGPGHEFSKKIYLEKVTA